MATDVKGTAQLRKAVLEASKSDDWDEATQEWELTEVNFDPNGSTDCVCGQRGLHHLYTIANRNTGKELYPIGSDCITLFDNQELNQAMKDRETLKHLYESFLTNEPVDMSINYFSRRVLKLMQWAGAFDGGYYDDADKVLDICLSQFSGRIEHVRRGFAVKHIIEDHIRPWVMHVSNWDGSGQSLADFYRDDDDDVSEEDSN